VSPAIVREVVADSLADDIFSTLFESGDVVFDLWNYGGPLLPSGGISREAELTVLGAVKMIERAVASRVDRMVFASSGGAVYGVTPSVAVSEVTPTRPISQYGLAKLTVERYLDLFRHAYDANYITLRLANVYGPTDRFGPSRNVIANLLKCLVDKTPFIVWGDGTITRDYVFITDVIEAFRLAADSTLGCGVFNIGTGTGTSISKLAEVCFTVTGRSVDIHYQNGRPCDVPFNVLDCRKAAEELQWIPHVPLSRGIAATWDYVVKELSAWTH
jgi:UDP-glucose 4-epimerase